MSTKDSLPPDVQTALDRFDEAAREWGWAESECVGRHHDEASLAYVSAKSALVELLKTVLCS